MKAHSPHRAYWVEIILLWVDFFWFLSSVICSGLPDYTCSIFLVALTVQNSTTKVDESKSQCYDHDHSPWPWSWSWLWSLLWLWPWPFKETKDSSIIWIVATGQFCNVCVVLLLKLILYIMPLKMYHWNKYDKSYRWNDAQTK